LLVVAGAVLYTLAVPPLGWSWAGWIALTPLMLVVRGCGPKWAGVAGFAYGVLICAGVAWWLRRAVSDYFALAFPLDLLVTFAAYGLYVGIYIGLTAVGWSLLMRRGGLELWRLAVPALWVACEFARSSLFAGFSWELLGYSAYRDTRLIQIADLTGVYGLSFLMALCSYVAAELIAAAVARPRQPGLSCGFIFAAPATLLAAVLLALLYGEMRVREYRRAPCSRSATIALVRTTPAGARRFQRAHYASTMAQYVRLTETALTPGQAAFVIWPEFALGFYLDRELMLRAELSQVARAMNSALLIGAPRFEGSGNETRYYNSAYLFRADGQLEGAYDKIRLLPFAESRPPPLPFGSGGPQSTGGFTRGRGSTLLALPEGGFGVLICYESTYPNLARGLVRRGARFLVNISNDDWLTKGGNAASRQHFSMTVLRAIENRRAIAVDATAGISGFID